MPRSPESLGQPEENPNALKLSQEEKDWIWGELEDYSKDKISGQDEKRRQDVRKKIESKINGILPVDLKHEDFEALKDFLSRPENNEPSFNSEVLAEEIGRIVDAKLAAAKAQTQQEADAKQDVSAGDELDKRRRESNRAIDKATKSGAQRFLDEIQRDKDEGADALTTRQAKDAEILAETKRIQEDLSRDQEEQLDKDFAADIKKQDDMNARRRDIANERRDNPSSTPDALGSILAAEEKSQEKKALNTL